MKIAIISDIHSNLNALKEVLKDIEKEGISSIFNLGDTVGYAAQPNECLDLVKEKCSLCIRGNHDAAVCDYMPYEFFNPFAIKAIDYTKKTISNVNMQYLSKLDLVQKTDDLVFVHSSPVFPDNWTYITNEDAAEMVFMTMSMTTSKIVFIGHSHIPVIFKQKGGKVFEFTKPDYMELEEDEKAIVNVGSVGQPRDLDPRACYVIFDPDKKSVQYKRIEYDIDAAFDLIISNGLPPILAERLKRGK